MKIRSIIIDDELNNIENLQGIIDTYCTEVEVVATASSVPQAASLIDKYKPDLIFLDIQMPGESGFDLLKTFDKINFEIIFITAFDQYGIQAIKFSALDYLLKPININEFKLAITKAEQKINSRKENYNIGNLMEYLKSGTNHIPKIALPAFTETLYVKITDIIRCEASNNYTNFYLDTGEVVLVCKTLKEFADILKSHRFLRTHQSHLVNLNFVKSYLNEDGGALRLNDQTKIPVSRQNREIVKQTLSRNL